ncbi:MAG: baseplate J/gp47 family protein [Pseudomonadota bacterium]
MPFERPSHDQVLDAVLATIEARLAGADARLRHSDLNVQARVLAEALHDLNGFGTYVANQVIYDRAEREFLVRWAGIWGVELKEAATAAGAVTFTGTSGSTVLVDTLLQRTDGRRYKTTASATLEGGSATIAVTALEAGSGGNADAGAKLQLVAPIAGVQSAATVAAPGLAGGTEEEDTESLLARLLERIQAPPHGGAVSDYVRWAKEVAGVAKAWSRIVEDEPGHKRVVVYFTMQGADPIPTAADVTAVQAHLDLVRPVTAQVNAVAPVAVPLALTIQGLTPDTPEIRAAIEAEIADLLLREAAPGATILLSHIREAISLAAGEHDHQLAAPLADVVHAEHEMAVFAPIQWT